MTENRKSRVQLLTHVYLENGS